MNNFLNIHLLNSLAFANPNRDDAGAPKTAFYGGVERARMSSQALKRAARVGYESAVGAPTVRTADVAELVLQDLKSRGVDELDDQVWGRVDQSIRTLVEANPKAKLRSSEGTEEVEAGESGDTLMWVSAAEVRAISEVLEPSLRKGGKLSSGGALSTKDLKEVAAEMRAAVTEPSLSIAAFGRMFANSVGNAVDAAVQVSHAISTHAHLIEVDYFTAVDDLQEHGAGHIGLNMYTGAVYYRHLCIDRAQLQANVGGRLPQLGADVSRLLHSMCVELPTGKQAGAAHQSLPTMILAIEGARPANLVEAFERPVDSAGGFIAPSVEALAEYLSDVRAFAPDVFGSSWVAGRSAFREPFSDASSVDMNGLLTAATDWVLERAR